MIKAGPVFSVALAAALILSGAAPAHGAGQAEVPVSITAFDEATIAALADREPVQTSFTPVAVPDAVDLVNSTPEDLRLIAAKAAYIRTVPGLADLESLEVMTGPQGTLFGNPRITLGNEPTRSFYETNQVATVVVAEVAGWPERSEDEIYELAVAFNYVGDEVLNDSPYPGDPLEGFGNVSSFGWFGSEVLENYAKWQQGTWTQYVDPLLRSEMRAVDGRLFASWLLPGTPESIAINLSYSSEPTIQEMVAQHVDVALPTEILELSLTSRYGDLDPGLKTTYEDLFTGGEQAGVDEPVESATETPPVTDGPSEGGTSETESQPAVSDQNGDPGGLPIVAILFILAFGAGLAWLLLRWFVGRGDNEVADADDGPVPEENDHQPVIRSHPGAPPQVMTAREEALGLAEGMVGVVVDGWYLLPWEVGSDFFVAGDGRTYRTLPVADTDVLTDVSFLGEPDGFEPDASRFAYWLHEDGTLKIGAPNDPHAHSAPAGSDGGEPLEAMLPLPGEGQSLLDVANERLIRSHELTEGSPPIEGWIAPSVEAHGAALLSDAGLRPGVDPGSWSGHFFNIETGEWVNATDPRYRGLVEKLGVIPPAKPVESNDPVDMDGDVHLS